MSNPNTSKAAIKERHQAKQEPKNLEQALESAAPTEQAPTVLIPTVTAKQLAEELNMDPKELRKTLRALAQKKAIQPKNGVWHWSPDSPDIDVIRKAFAPKKQAPATN